MKCKLMLLAAMLLMAGCIDKPLNEKARIFKYKLGKVEIVQLTDQEANISPNILNVQNPDNYTGLTPDLGFVSSTSSYLLRSEDKKYLFDAGIGDWMTVNLEGIGEYVSGIEKIFFTDMRMDHIGRMIWLNKVVYPNAQLYFPRREFEYWTSEENMQANLNRKSQFVAAMEVAEFYKDRITLFDPASMEDGGTKLEEGITAFDAPGVTPGHTIYLIESGKKKLLIWGDITQVHDVQIMFPDVTTRYDFDAKQVVETRLKVLEYAAVNEIPVAGTHIIYPGIGKIIKKDGKYTFKPVRARYRPFTANL